MAKAKATRTERRDALREARVLAERGLLIATEVEAGLKKVVNSLPLRRRVGIAVRIVGRRWK